MNHSIGLLVELVRAGNLNDLDAWRQLADALEDMGAPVPLIISLRLHADLCETPVKVRSATTEIGILPGYALLDFVKVRYGEGAIAELTPYLSLSGRRD